ncbi:DNA-binding domain-containing protein [soil metagenome]
MSLAAQLVMQQQALQAAVSASAEAGNLLQSPAGLAIYQDAYRARLLAALRDNFSVLQRALGDDEFDALGLAYLQAHPSTEPSIRWFGHRLAAFIDETELCHPAMADFARMDWALRAAFDAADAALLMATDLQALAPHDWPGLTFRLHPSVQLLPLQWAIEPAWRALREAEDGGEDAELDAPEPLAHTLLVWRQGLDTRWRSLAPLEAALLQALAEGASFAAICAVAAQSHEDAAQQVVSALQRWLSDDLLGR